MGRRADLPGKRGREALDRRHPAPAPPAPTSPASGEVKAEIVLSLDEGTTGATAVAVGLAGDITGLVLDPYFRATKYAWALKTIPGAKDAAAGTVDSWLIARLSAGRDHLTDASNASRTLLYDIDHGAWSENMAELFGVSLDNLPRVVDSSGHISAANSDAF